MDQFRGPATRYVSQELVNRVRILKRVCLVIGLLGVLEGLFLSPFVPSLNLPPLLFGLLAFAALPLILWSGREIERRLDSSEKRRRNF